MLPLKAAEENRFQKGVTFDDVLSLYLFDREFRILVFDLIEKLEVAFRTQLIYHPALAGGAFWYEDARNFIDPESLADHLRKLDEEVERATETFKDHFYNKYVLHKRMPAWMAFEVVSFGLLSKIYRNLLNSAAKKAISRHFGLTSPYVLESWTQSLAYVRNTCAHHSRLWNRILTLKPQTLKTKPDTGLWIENTPPNNKMYYFLCCTLFMLRSINPRTRFVKHLKSLLARYPHIPLQNMGFPIEWEKEAFWQ